MRRAIGLVIVLAACVLAQSARDVYRASYRVWREADSTLERDAATGDAKVADRAGREAALAAKYGADRAAYLRQLAAGDGRTSTWLEGAASPELLAPSLYPEQYVAGETAAVSRNMDTFTNDPDKGIQMLREELGHERAALTALSNAMAERHKAADGARAAAAAADQARVKALGKNQDWIAGLNQTAGLFGRETAAWSAYYRSLAESVQSPPATSAIGPTTAETPRPGAQGKNASAAPLNGPSLNAPPALNPPTLNAPPALSPPAPRSAPPDLRPPVPSITSPPLVRYVGAWSFPASNGLYHGAQPELIDLSVNEENGHAKGALSGRFKLPPGSSGDPLLRLDFAGDFRNTRTQTFDLRTSNGAQGTIELIPGPAFNLLEVNIHINPTPGKITQVNAILVKK